MLDYLLPAMSLALAAVSIPGALQTYLLSVTLRDGVRNGAMVAFSPLVSDGPIIVLMVFLLGALPPWFISGIQLVGGLVLLWIAWGLFQQLDANTIFTADDNLDAGTQSPLQVLAKATAINALNPGPWLFWSVVIGPLFITAIDDSALHGGAVLVGFYGVFLGALLLLVLAFNQLGRIDPRVTQGVMILALALLVWFATDFMAQSVEQMALHRLTMPVVILALIVWLTRRYWDRFTTSQRKLKSNGGGRLDS